MRILPPILTVFCGSSGVLDSRGRYQPVLFGCIVSSIACRQPIFNTDDHAATRRIACLVSRIPFLRFSGKLSEGNRLLKLFLAWHLIHMVVDEFLQMLSD